MNEPGKIRGNAFVCNSVDWTIQALTHELIKEDTRLCKLESKRGNVNIYRMGHYLTALKGVTEPKPASMFELAVRVSKAFCEGFGPRERVLKGIKEYLESFK